MYLINVAKNFLLHASGLGCVKVVGEMATHLLSYGQEMIIKTEDHSKK